MEQDNNFVLTLPLMTEPWQSDIIDRRMDYLRLLYNYVQGKLLRQYRYFSQLDEYKAIKTFKERIDFFRTHPFTVKGIIGRDKSPLDVTFTEYGITNFVEKLNQRTTGDKTYKELGINTSYLDALADNIWASWDYFLYYKGKSVHFKRKGDLNTFVIRMKKSHGKNDFAGLDIDLEKRTIGFKLNSAVGKKEKWMTLSFGTDRPTDYEKEAFSLGFESIRTVTIVRKKREGKSKYYIQLTFRGSHSNKDRKLGEGCVGIYISPSNIAVSSPIGLSIDKLADRADSIEHEKRLIERKIDRSLRANNPQNYNEDGTVKRHTRLVWHLSNRYKGLVAELSELQRHQAAVRKNQQIDLANTLLKLGDTFIVENNVTNSWKPENTAPDTSKQDKKPLNARKGNKRVAYQAPSQFVTILKEKVSSLGGRFIEVDQDNSLSIFDFTDCSFHQCKQNERYFTLSNGISHRCDLLSAFNLQHLRPESEDKNDYDVAAMIKDYPFFCHLEGETCRLDPKKETREKEIQD